MSIYLSTNFNSNENQKTDYTYLDPTDASEASNNPYLVKEVTSDNGAKTCYEYNADDNVTSIEDPQGNITHFRYTEDVDPTPLTAHKHLVKEIERPPVTVEGVIQTTNLVTKFDYDNKRNLTKITDALGGIQEFSYAADGKILTSKDELGRITTFNYEGIAFDGSRRRLQSISTPRGLAAENLTRSVYFHYTDADNLDNVTRIVDELGHEVEMEYDAGDRVTQMTDARGKVTNYLYQNYELHEVQRPANSGSAGALRRVRLEYDRRARLSKVLEEKSQDNFEMRVGYTYNPFSEVEKITRLQQGIEKHYKVKRDALGRTIEATDFHEEFEEGQEPQGYQIPDPRIVEFDDACQGRRETSLELKRQDIGVDSRCQVTEIQSGVVTNEYSYSIDKESENRTFEYDEWNRLVRSTHERYSRYEEAIYKLDRWVRDKTERQFIYDSLDRVVKIIYTDNNEPPEETLYEYDAVGNITKETTPDGKVTRYEYYQDDLLYKVILERSNQNDDEFVYFYDVLGRLKEIKYPSSTGMICEMSDLSGTENSGYDPNGNLLHLRYLKNGALLRRFEYSYDDSNNRISKLDVSPSRAIKEEYSYDWFDRLDGVKRAEAPTIAQLGALQLVEVYAYDESDNRISFELPVTNERYDYQHDLNDALTLMTKSTAGVTDYTENFSYSLDGNLTSRTRSDTGETLTYKWSDIDRMLRVESSVDGRKQDNRFDVDGLRRRKMDKDAEVHNDVGSGLSIHRSKTSTDSIHYFTGHLLLGAEVNGIRQYFLHDALSSVAEVVDANGNSMASYEFGVFGNVQGSSGPGLSQVAPRTFVGGMFVQDDTEDTGLYLCGHRFYLPNPIGRFINRDPIGFSGGMNVYNYTTSPVMMIDPEGLNPLGGAATSIPPSVSIPQGTHLRVVGSGSASTGGASSLLSRISSGLAIGSVVLAGGEFLNSILEAELSQYEEARAHEDFEDTLDRRLRQLKNEDCDPDFGKKKKKKRKGWHCKTKCHKLKIPGISVVGYAYGEAIHKMRPIAESLSETAARNSTGVGYRTRHCQTKCVKV